MKDRLRLYVVELFEDGPQTRKAHELREELLANLNDKYDDLIAKDFTPEEAYKVVISGIGDTDELIRGLREPQTLYPSETNAARKKSALLTSIAVMLFILSALAFIVADAFANEMLGMVLFFLMVAAGVGLLVYNSMSRPRYLKKEDTVVEDFKEYNSGSKRNRRLRDAVVSSMWCLIVAIYFIYNFSTGGWGHSWIIFLIGAAITVIVNAVFALKE